MPGADSRSDGHVAVGSFGDEGALTLSAGPTQVTLLPEVGLLGASLRHDGAEFLDLHGGADAARHQHTTGMPLLAPWANRLGGDEYSVLGREVELQGAPGLHRDANGLPMHGTLVGRAGWELMSVRSRGESAAAVARFRAGDDPEVMASFPFPHDLTVTFTVTPGQLTVATLLVPTGERAVPVSFGWHPYFRLADVPRHALRLELPDRKHLLVDERQLPSGGQVAEPAETVVLAGRTFDDGYRLGRARRFGLVGGGRRLEAVFERGYPYAQVYAPADHDYVALEPMTAPTDALRRGAAPVVDPGGRYSARYRVSLT